MRANTEEISPNRWWLNEEEIAVKLGTQQNYGIHGVDLATNPNCRPAAVQINMPSVPGDVDGNSQVGRDPSPARRVWLLRQGRLKPNPVSAQLIAGQRFQDLTGLPRAFETPSNGDSPARWWFRVCRLDVPDAFIREQTVDFVWRCQRAREEAATASRPPAGDPDLAAALQGNLEPTGSYVIPPHDARVAARLHGRVVNELKRRLDQQTIPARKVYHIDGYEVDLAIERVGSSSLLVEVKTGATARDVQTGIGQLVLYRRLMRGLHNHTPVLLLPAPPTPALASAVRECGVAWHIYRWSGQVAGQGEISFDERFTSLCGLR
jgi:hypothetical protein